MTTSPDNRHAIVIGAGIVGLCCARALQRDGWQVSVVDPDEPGRGTSYGNAGILATGSVLPEGKPGLWKRVPGMLMDPTGPLTIRWSYLPWLLPYLARLLRECTPERYQELSRALATLVSDGLIHYLDLLDDADVESSLIRRNGCLYLHDTPAALAAARVDNVTRRQRGVEIEELGPDEVRQLLPALGPDVAGGTLAVQSGHTVNPLRLAQTVAGRIEQHGGQFIRQRATGFEFSGSTVSHVVCEGGRHACDAVVVAAGAFSKPLARALGGRAILDTERGYHMMLPNPGFELRLPLLVPSGGYAVTPMEHGIRLAGTVEFGGLKAPPNYARADILVDKARRLFPDLDASGGERWMGYRPATPDSLPVIGPSPRHPNAWFAFGHGHLGVSLGAVTGHMIAAMAGGRTPPVDPAPFSISRF
jgi:D-amino-acid dehydrogenase